MTAQTIKVSCPKCGTSVDLSQAVQEELVRDIQEQTRRVIETEKSLELNNLQGLLKEKMNSSSKRVTWNWNCAKRARIWRKEPGTSTWKLRAAWMKNASKSPERRVRRPRTNSA